MRGFTLIEALIAFSILAIVVGVTASSLSSGLAASRQAGAAQIRLDQARSLFAALGVATPLAPGETRGVFSTGEAWRLAVAEARPPGMLRVDLTVFDRDRPALNLSVLKAAR